MALARFRIGWDRFEDERTTQDEVDRIEDGGRIKSPVPRAMFGSSEVEERRGERKGRSKRRVGAKETK